MTGPIQMIYLKKYNELNVGTIRNLKLTEIVPQSALTRLFNDEGI